MNKRELMNLYQEAYIKIQRLNLELEKIKNENENLAHRVKELFEENKILKEKEIIIESPAKNEPIVIHEYITPSDTGYAAKSIGRIVVSATKHCNAITNTVNETDIKDHINLILGRTEIAKSEILNIIEMSIDLESKKNLIDREEQDANKYFLNIRAQI